VIVVPAARPAARQATTVLLAVALFALADLMRFDR
jgi:hypothetical protein